MSQVLGDTCLIIITVMNKKIAIIGGGNLGSAIAEVIFGLLRFTKKLIVKKGKMILKEGYEIFGKKNDKGQK